ncbi:hypothetical protein ACFLZV_06695 [Candidatus Margulisiibacteriota bacterium]
MNSFLYPTSGLIIGLLFLVILVMTIYLISNLTRFVSFKNSQYKQEPRLSGDEDIVAAIYAALYSCRKQ